jgi:hypothetical protein
MLISLLTSISSSFGKLPDEEEDEEDEEASEDVEDGLLLALLLLWAKTLFAVLLIMLLKFAWVKLAFKFSMLSILYEEYMISK